MGGSGDPELSPIHHGFQYYFTNGLDEGVSLQLGKASFPKTGWAIQHPKDQLHAAAAAGLGLLTHEPRFLRIALADAPRHSKSRGRWKPPRIDSSIKLAGFIPWGYPKSSINHPAIGVAPLEVLPLRHTGIICEMFHQFPDCLPLPLFSVTFAAWSRGLPHGGFLKRGYP